MFCAPKKFAQKFRFLRVGETDKNWPEIEGLPETAHKNS
jgi:hypothetical protein